MHEDDPELASVRRERFADKKETSGRIGETSRFIAFGIVALVFSIHGSDSALSKTIIQSHERLLNFSGLLGCLAVTMDYLQYVCGYFSVNKALKRHDSRYAYDGNEIFYRGRIFFFWGKQFSSFIAAAIVIYLISVFIITT